MSLSDLASLGSFISGAAVLASLVFLFFQMRQMTEQSRQTERNQRALMQQGRAARHIPIVLSRTQPHLSAALAQLNDDFRKVGPAESNSVRAWIDAGLYGYQDSFEQYRLGTLPEASWEMDLAMLRAMAAWAGFRAEWSFMRQGMPREFRELVDGLVRETPPTGVWSHADWIARYAQELPPN